MKQVVSTAEGVRVVEVPSPTVQPGQVLVEVEYSFVSSGTELATLKAVESRRGGLASHVASNPSLIGRAMGRLRSQGVGGAVAGVAEHLRARRASADRLESLGYSCSGRVVEVGAGVATFAPGDRVACAGANRATHSELVSVPENLTAHVPDGCEMSGASSVAIGAIAMQGTRRIDAGLGGHVVVIGLGLVGLIAVQLLKLAGARVIGLDPDERRVEQALGFGIDGGHTDPYEVRRLVERATGHMGADACLIAASSDDSGMVQTAIELTRKRGKVVVVGIVGMDLQRDPLLRNEIDLLVSSSYGPGRYDDGYEEKGRDYPYAYVRWTEKRNMEEYLRLLAKARVRVDGLAEEYPLESAVEAYSRLEESSSRPVAVVLKHRTDQPLDRKTRTRVEVSKARRTGRPRIAVAGAGRFVQRVHLPSLARMGDSVELAAVVTRRGDRAVDVARRFGATYAATSYDEVVGDSEIDAVLIGTRHDLHADMVLKALEVGKHVLVEKPLAMTEEEMQAIEAVYANGSPDGPPPVLLTGFNRRFTPLAARLKAAVQEHANPLVMSYQMNVGHLPEDHWLRTEEGGGRNIGEACHVYDMFTFLTDSEVVDVRASAITPRDGSHARNENFTATITFRDGSTGALTFTSLGSPAHPKELLHVYADGTVYVLTDYARLETYGTGVDTDSSRTPSKGHEEELRAFVDAIGGGVEWPIPLWQQVQATRIALTVERAVQSGMGP